MCNSLKKLIATFVVVLLVQPITCFAEELQENYHELFSYAAQADGAYSEGVRDNLAQAFKNDAHAFVSALAIEERAVQMQIVMLLVYNPNFTCDDLLAIVGQLSSQLNWNEAEQHILHLLREEILTAQANAEASHSRIFDVLSGLDPLEMAGVLSYIQRNYTHDPEYLLTLIAQQSKENQSVIVIVAAHLIYPINPQGYEIFFTSVCNSDTYSLEEKLVAQQFLAQTDNINVQQNGITPETSVPGHDESTFDLAWYVVGVLFLLLCGETSYILLKKKS